MGEDCRSAAGGGRSAVEHLKCQGPNFEADAGVTIAGSREPAPPKSPPSGRPVPGVLKKREQPSKIDDWKVTLKQLLPEDVQSEDLAACAALAAKLQESAAALLGACRALCLDEAMLIPILWEKLFSQPSPCRTGCAEAAREEASTCTPATSVAASHKSLASLAPDSPGARASERVVKRISLQPAEMALRSRTSVEQAMLDEDWESDGVGSAHIAMCKYAYLQAKSRRRRGSEANTTDDVPPGILRREGCDQARFRRAATLGRPDTDERARASTWSASKATRVVSDPLAQSIEIVRSETETPKKLTRHLTTFDSKGDFDVACPSSPSTSRAMQGLHFKHLRCHPSKAYEMEAEVGAGTFGSVRKAVHRATSQVHAVKTCPKRLIPEHSLWSEIRVMRMLDHPHIVRLYYTFEDDTNMYLASELCEGGQLLDAIVEAGRLSERTAARLFRQMMSATSYLHYNRICHRDLKPDNFLLQSSDSLGKTQVKMIDFGTAKRFDHSPMTTKVCTVHYVAPEVLKRSMVPYTEKVDVWSCGVVLFIMLSGTPPFHDDDDTNLLKLVKKGKWEFHPKQAWEAKSGLVKDFVKELLCVKVESRLSASQALQHSWLQDGDDGRERERADSIGLSRQLRAQMRAFASHSRLKKLALQVIARRVPDETIRMLTDCFLKIDKDNSGCLTLDEVDQAVEDVDCEESARVELKRLMCAVDTDGDGVVNFTEFVAATIQGQTYLRDEACRAAFTIFDVDGDGLITREDLAALLCCRPSGEESGEWSPAGIDEKDVMHIMDEVVEKRSEGLRFEDFMGMMFDDGLAACRTVSAPTIGLGFQLA